MVSREHALILVEDELPGAQAWAGRHGVSLLWVPKSLEVRATLTQPETKELFYLRGVFDDYRELPPVWSFTAEEWAAAPAMCLFPKVQNTPYRAPLFIDSTAGR